MNQLFQETMSSFFEGLMRDIAATVEQVLPSAVAAGCGVTVTASWSATSVNIETKVDPDVAEVGFVNYVLCWD